MFINPLVSAVCDEAVDILSCLNVETLGIVAFGSILSTDLWQSDSSDIDLNVFIAQEWHKNISSLAVALKKELTQAHLLPWESLPHLVIDSLQPRVEAVFFLRNMRVDVTWSTATVQINDSGPEVLDDQLEVYLGQMYQYGELLTGKRVPCIPLGDVLPYYKDQQLWQSRLKTTEEGFSAMSRQALVEASGRDFVASRRSFFKARRYFWQALCQQRRKYPISNEKHIPYQLQKLYGLNLTFYDDKLTQLNIIRDAILELKKILE